MGKISMFLAVSLLMLHTLYPHHHINQIPEEEHVIERAQANSLLDYIHLALHLNPGENHLEEFEQASYVSVYFPVADLPLFEVLTQIPVTTDQVFDEKQATLIEDQSVFLSISFRGPPQLV